MKDSEFFDVAEQLRDCQSRADIHELCANRAKALGFEYFLFQSYFPSVDDIIVLNGFPDEWHHQYVECGYINIDPTVKHCSSNTLPIYWDQIKWPKGRGSVSERKMMQEARSHGLNQGVSLPVHGPGAEWSMLSLVTRAATLPTGENQTFLLEYFARLVHESIKQVMADDIQKSMGANELTARERECLQWTANGKTAWEIAKILNLSESTITFHLKNAINKLKVNNRPQAVAKAIAQSRIRLF